jgi:hypothetical protein
MCLACSRTLAPKLKLVSLTIPLGECMGYPSASGSRDNSLSEGDGAQAR